jgi:hypothetical protein
MLLSRHTRWRVVIILLSSLAATWPLAARAQEPAMMQPNQSTTATSPKIDVVRVKPLDPAAPKPRFQLKDGMVDLMKTSTLGGLEGIGHTWKLPPTGVRRALRAMVNSPISVPCP